MKNKYILWGWLLFVCIDTIAQNNLPPVCEIKTDTASYQNLDSAHWQILEDPTGKLTIEDVSKPSISDKFHQDRTGTKGIDYSINTLWFRYRLKNTMTHDAKIAIPSDAACTDVYTPGSNGKWDRQITGSLIPWSKRNGLKRIAYLLYIIQPGKELLFYERNKYNYRYSRPEAFAPGFSFTDKVIAQYYIDGDFNDFSNVLASVRFGILIIAVFFNLLFYKVVREKEYLFFSLFLLFLGLQSLGYQISNVFIREYPAITLNFYDLFVILFFFFMLHFFRHFLKTFQYYPRWDKFLFVLSFVMAVDFIIFIYILPITSLSSKHYAVVFAVLVSIPNLYMIFILVTLLLFIRNPDKSVNLKVISALPIFFFWGIGFSINQLYSVLNKFYNVEIPLLAIWLDNWTDVIQAICLTWLVVLFSWILFQRYEKLRKDLANVALEKEQLAKEKEIERSQLIELQKVELEKQVENRTAELKQSLHDLKSIQKQLIQSEKMASLGELTAGIAHEIQNPLNFINNFSEVNGELIEEMSQEIDKGNNGEVKLIANNIKENEQKISQHGKRADAIVKGMLQHSKASTGQKELTDINVLVDEYLRLSYHGLRAKDKTFNATIETDFDPDLSSVGEKINIVPQDIGRVLLNLYNNAFYTVAEKKKQQPEGYEPTVSVSTRIISPPAGGGVRRAEIRVKDSGNGIPQKVLDKIFQPFFTTKPTGQGTGLGLSLSYDIIKAHGGTIKVETKEGEGAEFVIQLPLS